MTKPAAELSRRALLPVALAALFMLAGCGIKGPLELPEGTQVSGNEGKGKGKRSPASDLPGYKHTPREKREYKQLGKPIKPDEPFFLDPLLK